MCSSFSSLFCSIVDKRINIRGFTESLSPNFVQNRIFKSWFKPMNELNCMAPPFFPKYWFLHIFPGTPAGATKLGEDCPVGAGKGTLAAGDPAGEGAARKGEPEDRRPGSSARCSSRGKSDCSVSCSRHADAEPRGDGGRVKSCRERANSVHEPGESQLAPVLQKEKFYPCQ